MPASDPKLIDLTFPGSAITVATAINDNGQIVGWYANALENPPFNDPSRLGPVHGFIFDPDQGAMLQSMDDLAGAAMVEPQAISSAGMIVGDFSPAIEPRPGTVAGSGCTQVPGFRGPSCMLAASRDPDRGLVYDPSKPEGARYTALPYYADYDPVTHANCLPGPFPGTPMYLKGINAAGEIAGNTSVYQQNGECTGGNATPFAFLLRIGAPGPGGTVPLPAGVRSDTPRYGRPQGLGRFALKCVGEDRYSAMDSDDITCQVRTIIRRPCADTLRLARGTRASRAS